MATLRHPENGCEWDRRAALRDDRPAHDRGSLRSRRRRRPRRPRARSAMSSATCCSRWCSRRASPKKPASSRSTTSPASIADKLEARHPHIFADEPPPGEARDHRWEALKAAERAHKGATSALDGVAHALPALMRSEKLQKRAAREDSTGPTPQGRRTSWLRKSANWRKLRPISNWKKLEICSSPRLTWCAPTASAPKRRCAPPTTSSSGRFRAMEALAAGSFGTLSLDQQEALWQQVKREEGAQPPA